jgi:hypothetical protein
MSISQISRALRNGGEFPMLAFIPGGGLKRTLLPEKVGSGKFGTPWARMQAAAFTGGGRPRKAGDDPGDRQTPGEASQHRQ